MDYFCVDFDKFMLLFVRGPFNPSIASAQPGGETEITTFTRIFVAAFKHPP
jgi:hypothetical protein